MIDVQVINNKPVVIEINANGSITSSGVQTVTGTYVNNADPQNPIVNVAPLESRIEDLEAILQSQSNFTGYAYAVWTGTGLIFDVFWPAYYIQGVRYEADTAQVTLDPADPTNPRLDVIAVDVTGAIKITGTAGVDPVKPTVDPLTQLEITTIFVAAGATTPTEITNEVIYTENAEWTGTTNNGTVVFNSAADPFSGAVSVECDAFDDTHYIRFTDSVTHSKSDFSVIIFALKLKSLWSGGSIPTYIKLKFYNAGVIVSSTHAVTSGSHNFSRTETTDYQTIVVPISAFTFTNPLFDRVEFTFEGLNPDGFYLDQIVLQTGAATVSPLQNTLVSIETDSGTANADTPDDTFQLLGAGGIQTSAVGKTITITAPATPDPSLASLLGLYKIDTAGTTPPVASGDIRYNNATQTSATSLYVSHLTDGGVDIDLFLSLLTDGTPLVIQDKNDSANYQIWTINGTPSFASATWTFPVTLNTSGGTGTTNFPNNHEVFLASFGGGGGGGHTIQDEGTPLTQRTNLNFTGNLVSATDDAGNNATDVDVNLTAANFGDFVVALTGKTTPIDADTLPISDSTASDDAKKVTWANIKATLKTYFDTLYQAVGTYLTPANIDDTAYNASSWDGATTVAPSKNAVRDILEKMRPFQTNLWFNQVLTIDQDLFLYASTITQISKTAGVATASYQINSGSINTITFTGNDWTGSIAVAANDRITWRITYTGGFTSANLSYLSNRT